MRRSYRVGEFAALTGVSIRTLHHYDEIGLLPPTGHSEGGHRLYAEDDLLRLQQVLTLRYLGFSLKQIGGLLDRPDFDLVASLQVQRLALRTRVKIRPLPAAPQGSANFRHGNQYLRQPGTHQRQMPWRNASEILREERPADYVNGATGF